MVLSERSAAHTATVQIRGPTSHSNITRADYERYVLASSVEPTANIRLVLLTLVTEPYCAGMHRVVLRRCDMREILRISKSVRS